MGEPGRKAHGTLYCLYNFLQICDYLKTKELKNPQESISQPIDSRCQALLLPLKPGPHAHTVVGLIVSREHAVPTAHLFKS